jgi:hypothetical protein
MTQRLVDALVTWITTKPERKPPEPRYLELTDRAPPALRPLLTALSKHEPKLELGWRVFDDEYESFEDVFDAFKVTDAYEGYFDPTNALLLGRWPGGEVFFGAVWEGSEVRFVELDPENILIKGWASPEAWFDRIFDDEIERAKTDGEAFPPDLVAIGEQLGKVIKAKKRKEPKPKPREEKPKAGQPRLVKVKRPSPAEPASAAYPGYKYLVFSDASPSGRRLVGHHFQNGFAAEVGVLEKSGELRKLAAETHDEYSGMALVPGTEKVLCTKTCPGDLLEVDLVSGKSGNRGIHNVRDPRFIDDAHFSLVQMTGDEEGELQAYRYTPDGALAPPIASVSLKGYLRHFAVGGHALVWSRVKKQHAWVVFRFEGERFERLGAASTDDSVFVDGCVANGKPYLFELYDGWFELVADRSG